MKQLILVLVIILTYSHSLLSQNKDTTLVSITNFRLDPGTHSWRGTNTYYDMTSWDSSPYTEGHLREKSGANWLFRMNYRLLMPMGYDANYDPGYPIIIMLHGAGERGNCWEDDCYCEGCNANGTPDASAKPEFLNNDHVLLHGGLPHLRAVNLAGSKKPNDPTLDARAFPGFVLFPQNENFWGTHTAGNSAVSYAIRIIRLLVKKYNIDPDRIYIHGLSFGGQAVYKAINMADWLFAAAATMSAISFNTSFEYDSAIHIPIWAFQGGKDKGPYPGQTEAFIKQFRQAGGTARYTLYPEVGHGTWNKAYNEPDFFSWFLSRSKSDIQILYGNSKICNNTGVKLALAPGFPAYQWERDGQMINGASGNTYEATTPGVYKARFSRVANPSAADWNEWSKPVTVQQEAPVQTKLTQIGTTYLKDLNDNTDAILVAPEGFESYQWYKDDVLVNLPDSNIVKITPGNCGVPCSNSGKYTVVTAGFENCPGLPSNAKYVFYQDQAPVDNSLRPSDFTFQLTSGSSAFLTWKDNTTNELGFEIWRKNTSVENGLWEMAALTERDVTQFHDTLLLANSVYYYKLRAISATGRSTYWPGDSETVAAENLIVTTKAGIPPTPPQNLRATQTGLNAITLSWGAGTDEVGIKEYTISYAGQVIKTGSTQTNYTISGLPINTLYSFTVRTVDLSGISSGPSNQITANTYSNGLFYKHTTGNWSDLDDPTMVDTWSTPDFTGKVDNFTLEPRTQDDYFNFEFEGYIFIATAGNYTFYINSNDGSRLFIDNVQQIDFDGVHNLCTGNAASTTCPSNWGKPSAVLNLSRGPHLIKVQMFEYTGAQDIQVRYKGPDSNNATVLIPTSALNSGSFTPPAPPAIPTNLAATAEGLTKIKLTWQSSAEVEIYRSLSATGGFTIVDRVSTSPYIDSLLNSGTKYFYQIRAVNEFAASNFTSVVNATTLTDTQAPGQPSQVALTLVNGQKVSLTWAASTDNVGVVGYEIWANGVLIGTSSVPGFEVSELEPETSYSFTVIAYDGAGNKSPASAAVVVETVTEAEEGIDDRLQVEVFPNPVDNEDITVKVVTSKPERVNLTFVDILGRTSFKQDYESAVISEGIRLNGEYQPGIYFILIKQGKREIKRKIMVK